MFENYAFVIWHYHLYFVPKNYIQHYFTSRCLKIMPLSFGIITNILYQKITSNITLHLDV
jgi:hypothetical protein